MGAGTQIEVDCPGTTQLLCNCSSQNSLFGKMCWGHCGVSVVEDSASLSNVLCNSGIAWRGEFLTRDISDLPKDVRECSLSEVLETQPLGKYYLSPKASKGLIRRQLRRPCLFVSQQGERVHWMTARLTLWTQAFGI